MGVAVVMPAGSRFFAEAMISITFCSRGSLMTPRGGR
jgi:hypothetical protein